MPNFLRVLNWEGGGFGMYVCMYVFTYVCATKMTSAVSANTEDRIRMMDRKFRIGNVTTHVCKLAVRIATYCVNSAFQWNWIFQKSIRKMQGHGKWRGWIFEMPATAVFGFERVYFARRNTTKSQSRFKPPKVSNAQVKNYLNFVRLSSNFQVKNNLNFVWLSSNFKVT
jgi:hypothetical protein